MARVHPIEELLRVLSEREGRQNKEQEIENKIKAAGYTEADWYRIVMFHETFNDQAGALAYYLTVASKTGDKDAARLGLQVTEYVAKRATWIESVFNASGVSLADMNMRTDMAQFRNRMQHAAGVFTRVLNGEDLSGCTADDLTNMADA
jgi:hypothetical protein